MDYLHKAKTDVPIENLISDAEDVPMGETAEDKFDAGSGAKAQV